MAGFVRKLRLGYLRVTFVLRHKWDDEEDKLYQRFEWKTKRIGLWFKTYKAVGVENFKKPSLWSKNMGKSFMVGINFIWINTWLDISWKVKDFSLKD